MPESGVLLTVATIRKGYLCAAVDVFIADASAQADMIELNVATPFSFCVV
jgi:hypothetical protein